MRLVRLAIANVNTTVGAVRTNVDRALNAIHQAHEGGATVVALPEQCIGGYPPEDLIQWRAFVESQHRELLRLAKETRSLGCAIVLGVTVPRDAHLYNAAALVHRGKICGFVPKEKLPLYNVFYEARTFSRGAAGIAEVAWGGAPCGDLIFDFDFGTVALEVCEDGWSPDGPMRRRCYAGAELVVNISASPYRVGVIDTRREMIATRAADNQATVVYSNLVGGNDGLIFDGGGFVSQNGRIVLEVPPFREGVSLVTVDLDRTARLRNENTTWRMDQEDFTMQAAERVKRIAVDGATDRKALKYPVPENGSFFLPEAFVATPPRTRFCEELLDALALGLGDYFEKTGAFKTIGVALSGGRDSLLALIVARRYIERRYAALSQAERKVKANEILRGFFMPTRFSSAETQAAAIAAAREFDAPLAIVSVDDAFTRELVDIEKMLQPGEAISELAKQNVQARVRAERMWTWANSAAGLFVQTSNMSEKAVGYATIGGDAEGALSVIANVPKTVVNYLLDYLLETTHSEAIRLTLIKPASAELADNQEDERELMPFAVLDACFALYAGEKMSPTEVCHVLQAMFPKEDPAKVEAWTLKFARLFVQSIYKWVQAPLSLHVGNLDLERERALQLPVVQKTEWQKV